MKIVFFGTPAYVVPIVDALYKAFKSRSNEAPIVAVVTQKPQPVGRKQFLEYSPVDTWAHKKGVPIYFDSREIIGKVQADLGVVAAYGAIIPEEVIDLFPKGIINIHPSLLPKYRGASPVQATIASGETQTGGTFILIDEQMDHGPILSQFKEVVHDQDTAETLRNRLFDKSAEILPGLIGAHMAGKVTPKPQEHDRASYTMTIKKAYGFVPWEYIESAIRGKALDKPFEVQFIKDYSLVLNALALERLLRALTPWPGMWTLIKLKTEEKRLKILKAHTEQPINQLTNQPINLFVIDEVQLEGKNPVSWKQFAQAYQLDLDS